MSGIVWVAVGLGLAGLILMGVARVVMPDRGGGGGDERMPPTDLQRAARWSLAVSVVLVVVAGVVVAGVGPERAYEEAGLRVGLGLLAVGSLAAAGAGAWWVVRASRSGGAVLDERDRAVLERAPMVQSLATILALAAWTVILTERFWSSGGVPLAYVQLVFWSCVLVNLLALPVGVLIGYRKGGSGG